ncbi:nucleotidyltransferase domain-containing protein [uncultured Endozoicomonas sp.]|uniref:nucleotidyltransferase domain-containing protein n=1 Tax=uncultured Endozoicomonas sp. TaxID=432652 RepID=UPI002613F7A5|nr:nucleotidyltransferase domain-containing protein [uncultured Endozoicomonas sp.]
MRLTPFQIETIKQHVQRCFGKTAEVWLFGSRVDPNKRGGDIDLYVETDLHEPDALVDAKLKALSAIKYEMGDQKIDLVIYRRGMPVEPIHFEALETGVRL